MKKVLSIALILILALALFAGCSSSKSYTFDVSTGDKIKITLDTSDGLDLSQSNGQFWVSRDGVDIITGVFIDPATYDTYYGTVMSDAETFNVISEDGYEVFYSLDTANGVEYDCIGLVDGSFTGYLLGSDSQTDAETAIASLTFELA